MAELIERSNAGRARSWPRSSPSMRRLDRPARDPLLQPAARSDRGDDLRPRVAARLRQAAAAAVVSGRDRLPAVGSRRLALCALAGRGDRCLHRRVDDGAAARWRRRRAGRDPDHRRHALFQSHRSQVQSRRDPDAALGAGRLRLSRRVAAAAGSATGSCSAWRSARAGGPNISSWCSARRSRCSCCSIRSAPPIGRARTLDRRRRRARHRGRPASLSGCGSTARSRSAMRKRAGGAGARRRSIISLHPLEFLGGQVFFLLPALLIAAPLFWPPSEAIAPGPPADAFDRRIVTLLAFGPALTLFVFSLVTGRGTNRDVGLSALAVPRALDRSVRAGGTRSRAPYPHRRNLGCGFRDLGRRLHRRLHGAAALSITAIVPRSFPASASPAAITQRFEQATGKKPAYIIASMWDGGNVAHYSGVHPQPRVLIDGLPRPRALDRSCRSAHPRRGCRVDRRRSVSRCRKALPRLAARRADRRAVRPAVPRGEARLHVGWAVLPPQAQVVPAEQMRPLATASIYLCGRRCYVSRTIEAGERRNAELPEA